MEVAMVMDMVMVVTVATAESFVQEKSFVLPKIVLALFPMLEEATEWRSEHFGAHIESK